MTDQRDPLIERLESWLSQDDGSVLSERVMDAVISDLPATRQEGAGWMLASLSGSRVTKAGYVLAGLAAAAALILGYIRWTPDNVGEPSPSPEPSGTTAPEPSSTATPTPATISGLDVGGIGIVVATEPLVIRSAPGTGPASTILQGSLWPGMRFGIVEGPVTASGYDWYFVRVGELAGWAAMASRDGEPWMASVANGAFAYATSDDPWREPSRWGVFITAPGQGPSLIAELDVALETDLRSELGGGAVDCGGGADVVWSPQGDRIAVAAYAGCNAVIYTLDADGTNVVRHSDGQHPAWSPDGTRIAFGLNAPWFGCDPSFCTPPASGWEIQVAQPDGGTPVSLTRSPPMTSATNPLWSPDGRTIAFLSTDLSADWNLGLSYEVHLIDADGRRQRFLSHGQPVAWSPDGRSILVIRNVINTSPSELWVVQADGSGEVRLPEPIPWGYGAWTPDGSRIAVWGWTELGGSQVWLMRPDGSEVTPLVIPPDTNFSGWWSPDGRELVLGHELPDLQNEIIALTIADGQTRVLGEGFGAWQPVLVYPTP